MSFKDSKDNIRADIIPIQTFSNKYSPCVDITITPEHFSGFESYNEFKDSSWQSSSVNLSLNYDPFRYQEATISPLGLMNSNSFEWITSPKAEDKFESDVKFLKGGCKEQKRIKDYYKDITGDIEDDDWLGPDYLKEKHLNSWKGNLKNDVEGYGTCCRHSSNYPKFQIYKDSLDVAPHLNPYQNIDCTKTPDSWIFGLTPNNRISQSFSEKRNCDLELTESPESDNKVPIIEKVILGNKGPVDDAVDNFYAIHDSISFSNISSEDELVNIQREKKSDIQNSNKTRKLSVSAPSRLIIYNKLNGPVLNDDSHEGNRDCLNKGENHPLLVTTKLHLPGNNNGAAKFTNHSDDEIQNPVPPLAINRNLFVRYRQEYPLYNCRHGIDPNEIIYDARAPPNSPAAILTENMLKFHQNRFGVDLWCKLLKDMIPFANETMDEPSTLEITAYYINFLRSKLTVNHDEEFKRVLVKEGVL